MTDIRKQLVQRHIGSTLSEFMLEMCVACTDTSMQTTAPLADSSINDRLCSLVCQTCFEFLEVSLPSYPDAVVYQRIRWPKCWRNEVRYPLLQESDSARAQCHGAQARSQNIVRGGHRLHVEGHHANEGDITIA